MAVAAAAADTPPEKKKADAKSGTYSGCIDQRGEQYVLSGTSQMRTVAILRGKGFSDENFARYIGHSVTLTAEEQNEGETRILLVSKIDDRGAGCSGGSPTRQ